MIKVSFLLIFYYYFQNLVLKVMKRFYMEKKKVIHFLYES